jgi:hypothetical protein
VSGYGEIVMQGFATPDPPPNIKPTGLFFYCRNLHRSARPRSLPSHRKSRGPKQGSIYLVTVHRTELRRTASPRPISHHKFSLPGKPRKSSEAFFIPIVAGHFIGQGLADTVNLVIVTSAWKGE